MSAAEVQKKGTENVWGTQILISQEIQIELKYSLMTTKRRPNLFTL